MSESTPAAPDPGSSTARSSTAGGSWLITGGAGYIGAHVVRAMQRAGHDIVVLDNLVSGFRSFVPAEVPFVEASITDPEALTQLFADHQIAGVIHIAGFKYAGVSVERPLHTYLQNVTGTANLLQAMQVAGVDKMVFSSSAATFGTPDVDLVTESTPTIPQSPYGESKLIGEWLLADQEKAAGLQHTSMRYFNVVGSGDPEIYDASPHNLFPKVFQALLAGKTPTINGDDYPTPDGTNVRDYIHVADLAHSHVVAAERLAAGEPVERVYNLGSGGGSSVREIMAAVARATKIDFTPTIAPRRPGDPAQIVASGDLAARDLDWKMRHSLDDMVSSAWQAAQSRTS